MEEIVNVNTTEGRSDLFSSHPMPQQAFAEVTFKQYGELTPLERFLDEMNRVVPWAELVAVIEPVASKWPQEQIFQRKRELIKPSLVRRL